MKKCVHILSLLLFTSLLSGCGNDQPIIDESSSNLNALLQSINDSTKSNIDYFNRILEVSAEKEVDSIVIEANQNAPKTLPEFIRFGSILKGELVISTGHFLDIKWDVLNNYNSDGMQDAASLSCSFSYADGKEAEAIASAQKLIKDVSQEYGYELYQLNASLNSLEDINNKTVIKAYDSNSFYVGLYITDNKDKEAISCVLLYFAKEYPHNENSRLGKLIDSFEIEANAAGVSLDLTKEIVYDDRVVRFDSYSKTNEFSEDPAIRQEEMNLLIMAKKLETQEESE